MITRLARVLLEPAAVSVETGGTAANPIVTQTPVASSNAPVAQAPVSKPGNTPAKDTVFKIDDPSMFTNAHEVVKEFKTEQLPAVEKKEPNSNVTPPEKKEVKVAPETKPVAVEKKEPAKEVTPEAPKPIGVPKGEAKQFDLSPYSPEEQVVLKNMSVQSREYVAKIIKENKDLAKLKGAEYLQHPQAFILSPEFKELQENAHYANKEAMHWEEQLVRVEAGQEWQAITSWDKDGNPILGPAQKPDTRIKLRLQEAMMKCRQTANGYEQQAQQLQTTFADRVKNDSQQINNIRAQTFAWVADPKQLEDKVDIGGGNEKSIKQIREDFFSFFPSYLRHGPVIEAAADCFAGIQILQQQLRAAQSEKKVAEIKVEEVRRAEPSSVDRPATAGGKSGKMFSLEGMPR